VFLTQRKTTMQVFGISPRDGRLIEARERGAHRAAWSSGTGIAARDAAPREA
jgi:hypothetical protein